MNLEIPIGHTYLTIEDLNEARGMLKRWSDEWKDKKTMEMETFNGKRELNINEGETASSISQSRVSNKADKAAILASEAQKQFGGKVGGRKPEGGRNV
jgi:hypothetical protein